MSASPGLYDWLFFLMAQLASQGKRRILDKPCLTRTPQEVVVNRTDCSRADGLSDLCVWKHF